MPGKEPHLGSPADRRNREVEGRQSRAARQRGATGRMAETAYDIDSAALGPGHVVDLALMFMLMVAEMVRRSTGFMLAIRTHSRPTELDWQKQQEENREPAAHGDGL